MARVTGPVSNTPGDRPRRRLRLIQRRSISAGEAGVEAERFFRFVLKGKDLILLRVLIIFPLIIFLYEENFTSGSEENFTSASCSDLPGVGLFVFSILLISHCFVRRVAVVGPRENVEIGFSLA